MSQMAGSTDPKGQCFNALYPGVGHMVAIGASSTQSTAFQSTTTAIQVCSTVACFISLGSNPTAVANTSSYLPANVPVIYSCNLGDKIAVIQASSSGSLYVTEGA